MPCVKETDQKILDIRISDAQKAFVDANFKYLFIHDTQICFVIEQLH